MPNISNPYNDKAVGFKKEAETIINQLIYGSKEREVVLITGMGGLGKTTLARRLYKEKIVANHFDSNAWGTISQEYDYKDLLNKIYSQVCGREIEIDNVAEELRKSLMGRRYLIVLDDIWSVKAWEELNRVFPSCDNGSRIVLTSRQERVVSDAKHICLPFFTTDESWELLQVKLFKGSRCPEELENVGKEISKKCGGLPLVVCLIAGLLERVEKSEQMWHEFLLTINSCAEFRDGIRSKDAIKLSYHHLSYNLKHCLLYFAAFPEDKRIEVSYLIKLWISEGFIDIKEEERVEDTAKYCLNHLVGSNLVMVSERKYDGGILSCVVHDLVRDFCLAKVKEENFLHIIKMEDKLNSTLEFTPHRISFHRYGDNLIPNELVPWNSSIHTLLGYPKVHRNNGAKVYNVSWVGKKFEHLTILDIEFIGVDKLILSEINSLIHLRYLALYLCGCGSVSPLSLKNLEGLIKLTSYKDLHLPKYFWNMKSLRHMTIHHYNCDSCPTVPTPVNETISGLEVLQTLDLKTSLSTRDEHLLRKLPHLKYLSCLVSSSYSFAEIDILHHLESLRLYNSCDDKPYIHENPHLLNDLKLSKFPSGIKKINLEGITLSSSAISIIAQLSNLEALILACCKFEEGLEWNVDEETQFHKLKYLQLDHLDIRIWNICSVESFPCLEQVILDYCMELREVPYTLADISTLKLLSVRSCHNSIESSAKKIEEDVRDIGNEQLIVEIISSEMCRLLIFNSL
ncbi:putative late blight resistance protein homolog R1B-16 [Ipomoea triloba]|uniref:putative late blight resistance protein homolog R1B-16 n=1 Tax=Ipomoea triloba TaxID=35885 RepID=UPI00125D5EC1|nr:putative late blight resistance protein homolog R1B-16 [Ipomoea triloba]XP_031100152.1 putative late blight resistance protein homolog R1B-16 [Ipomoea triloba]XP_031100153.1 putative late blight resistance protein homolog R1B-16 [Ipomoea triloba]